MPKPGTAVTLKAFIEKEYVDNEEMGSPDFEVAMRDLMVDYLHLCFHANLNIDGMIETANEIVEAELMF
jgi:hypothetical protein